MGATNRRTRVPLSPSCPEYPWLYDAQYLKKNNSAFPQLRGTCSTRTGQHARVERFLQPIHPLRQPLRKLRQCTESHWSRYMNGNRQNPARKNQYQELRQNVDLSQEIQVLALARGSRMFPYSIANQRGSLPHPN